MGEGMVDKNEALTELCKKVIKAYSGSYKPHLLIYELIDNIDIGHTDEGYYFSSYKDNGNVIPQVEYKERALSSIVEKIISLNEPDVTWDKIATSDHVCHDITKWLGEWINENAKNIGYEFKQLEHSGNYFNHPTLCGIYQNNNTNKWVFIHQKDPNGDNPAGYLYARLNRYLPELAEDVVISICRQLRIPPLGINGLSCKQT